MKRVITFFATVLSVVTMSSCQKESMSSNAEIIELTGKSTQGTDNKNSPGAVYLLSNSTTENQVIQYNRSSDGKLSWAANYGTGGTGTGAGLGSQGAVILDRSSQYLYAVNAGSNEISVFDITSKGLTWVSNTSSGGQTPISITVYNNLLYVLNAGGAGNISGFTIDKGHLTSIPGSSQSLSTAAAGPAQIQFSNDGTKLVVTEKATNTIDVYAVHNGVAGSRMSFPSVGATPFGFAFGKRDQLIVSDANGGMPGLSALTSYSLSDAGNLSLITGPIGTTQTAACWVVITNNGRYAYTSNAGSASISGYYVDYDGSLSMINSDGRTGTTGMSPSDMALTRNSHYLYARNGGANSISIFEVLPSGALSNLGSVTGLPPGSAGLAAN